MRPVPVVRLRITRPRLRSLPLLLRTADGPRPAECLVLRLEVEIFGRPFAGYAALTVPGGADAPAQSEAVQRACKTALQVDGRNPFESCLQLRASLDPPPSAPPGERRIRRRAAALVERALLDAVARRSARPLGALLLDRRDNPLSCEWGRFHALLQGISSADFLPPVPYQTQQVRLPVHPGDPLAASEAADGRPRPLAATVRRGGITRFQIRVRGVRDIPFAVEALACIRLHAPPTWRWSLDAGGAFTDTSSFFETWTELRSHPALDDPLRRLEFIVHPFEPSAIAGARIERFFKGWPARLPVLLDPSGMPDADAFAALQLGYSGFVVTSADGLLRTVGWAGLLARLREERPQAPVVGAAVGVDGETPFGLGQDAATHAVAGNDVVTRRSLAESPDLDSQPLELRRSAVRALESLYEGDDPERAPDVAVQAGRLKLAAALVHPTGVPAVLGDQLFGVDDAWDLGGWSAA